MGRVISAVVESLSGTGMVERMTSLSVVVAIPGHTDRKNLLVYIYIFLNDLLFCYIHRLDR